MEILPGLLLSVLSHEPETLQLLVEARNMAVAG